MSKNIPKDLSPNQRAWQRLKKNKPAMAGIFIIFAAIVIAFLGYGITPDNTPNANDQVNEISVKKPGFTIKMLKILKNRNAEEVGLISTMLFGKPNPYTLVPINNYQIEGDSIHVEIYRGESASKGELLKGNSKVYHLVNVGRKLSINNPNIQNIGGNISFTDIDEQQQQIASTDLTKEIEKRNIYDRTYYFGTDEYGRDSLSRLIIGVRISLLVGLIAVFISLTIGIVMGAMAGYFGGRTDDIIMLVVNTVWSIPTLLLVFAIMLALGRGFWQIFLAVGLTMWVDVARIVRGQIMALREIQFVEAAVSLGFTDFRIISKHILPNILGPVMVIAAANFATAILVEAGLSYLGFGIQPPQPSWGTMIKENYVYLFSNNPFPAIVPAFAIMIMVLSFNLLGNGLRDALDVQGRT